MEKTINLCFDYRSEILFVEDLPLPSPLHPEGKYPDLQQASTFLGFREVIFGELFNTRLL